MALAPLVHPGSLVLALSDFAGLIDQGTWSRVAAHSESRWIWISDALERRALPDGRFRAGSPHPIVPVDGATIRRNWLAAWHEREARIRSSAHTSSTRLVELDTSEEVAAALARSLRPSKTAA
jgi:hypothetical protein